MRPTPARRPALSPVAVCALTLALGPTLKSVARSYFNARDVDALTLTCLPSLP